jgi:hypothetical protein
MRLKGNPHYDDNYTVENGRLINNAPPLEMGITKLCRLKETKKRTEKIMMKVEADEIAAGRIEIRKRLG